jgi:hypothetical protein
MKRRDFLSILGVAAAACCDAANKFASVHRRSPASARGYRAHDLMESEIRRAILACDDFRSWPFSSGSSANHFGSDWRKSGHSWRMLKPTRLTHKRHEAKPVKCC